jgi:glycosyltransferase involved in cell wall biosynthesis
MIYNQSSPTSDETFAHASDYDFIVLAPNEWDGLWMNRQQLMSRLGEHANVLYSRGAWFMWERAEALVKSSMLGEIKKQNNVWVEKAPAVMLRWPRIKLLNDLIKKQFSKRLTRMIDKRSYGKKRVLYLFHPKYLDYVDLIPHDLLVYHCYDDFITMPDSKPGMANKEHQLCQRADKIITSSEVNRDRFAADYEREDTVFIPNGVDFPLFNEASSDAPEFLDVMESDAPCVGYVGSINDKVDLRIVDSLTKEKPGVNFVFVGRVNNLSLSNAALWSKILNRSNTYHYPSCPREVVPQVLKNMSVNCIYYDLSGANFSSAGYPLKLHEYLASGVPVVSSGIRSVKSFDDVVAVADENAEWSALIDRAIADPENAPGNKSMRIETAKDNSWDNRILTLIDHILADKN